MLIMEPKILMSFNFKQTFCDFTELQKCHWIEHIQSMAQMF